MKVELVDTSAASVEGHVKLFARAFPGATHFEGPYLNWLYLSNPAGLVVGTDAWVEGRLAATYVTIPARLRVDGVQVRGLLSLNTATDPDFQGKGLFTRLATAVFERAAREGYACVYGIANANSTPGFTRKLGFELVEPLRAAIGTGHGYCADLAAARLGARLSREWNAEELSWRSRNPMNPLRAAGLGEVTEFRAKTQYPMLEATAALPGSWAKARRPFLRPAVYLGAVPSAFARRGAFIDIPGRLRPSPLNLIFRSLQGPTRLTAGEASISFLDFDAF